MSRCLFFLAAFLAFTAGTPATAGVYTWRGSSGAWSDAQNWNPTGVPSSEDTAIIAGGSVTVSAPVEVLRLEFSQGTLTRNADLTVRGGLHWTSGVIQGSGALHLLASASSEIAGSPYSALNTGPLNNAGVLIWTSGNFVLGGNVPFNNTGVFEARSNGIMVSGYSFIFNNSGTFRKVAGTGVTEIQAGGLFNNSGQVEVLSGTLAFGNGQSSGHFAGAAGTVLRISGTAVLTAESSLETAGDLDFASAANVYVRGALDVAGETRLEGGQAHVLSTDTRLGSLRITGGTLDLSPSGAVTLNSLQLLAGTLTGTSSLTVTGFFSWAGGALSGAGSLVLPAQSSTEFTGTASLVLYQRVIELQGDAIWTSTGSIYMNGESRISNAGTFEVRSQGGLRRAIYSSGGGTFVNTGTFTLAAASTFTIEGGLQFNNNGLVQLQQGTLQVGQGVSAGRFESQPSATLEISQWGKHELTAGATLALQGPLSITGSSSLHIAGALTLPEQVVLDGGTLAPNGSVTLTGQLEWLSGNIDGTGTLTLGPSAVLLQRGTAQRTLKARVENQGSLLLEGAALFNLANGTTLNNTGRIELRADTRMGGYGAVINNLPGGLFQKTGGTGISAFSNVRLNNQGTVEAVSGTLSFDAYYPYANDGFYQTAGATILRGGKIASYYSNSGTAPYRLKLHVDGGVLSGEGVVDADVISSGTVRPGLDGQTPGTLEIQGLYTQLAAGSLRIGIGGGAPGTGYGRLDVGSAKLDGTLELVQLRGYAPPPGDAVIPLRWLSGNRTGGFSSVTGQDFGPDAFLLYRYTATDLTLYNSRASLADVDVEVIGPSAGRPGVPAIYKMRIRNNNSVAMVVPVVLRLQRGSLLDMSPFEPGSDPYEDMVHRLVPGTPVPPPPGPGEQYPVLQRYFPSPDGSEYLVPLWVVVPPGGTYEQSVTTGCGSGVRVDMGKPFDPNQLSNCLFAASGLMLEFVPGYDCMKVFTTGLGAIANNQATGKAIDQAATLASMGFSMIQCAGDLLPATKAIKVLSKVNDLLGKGIAIDGFLSECGPYFKPEDKSGLGKAACVTSRDPNDKVGPAGASIHHDITGTGTLNYTVFFENDPDATAPAQSVTVTDTLDATALDFSTFSFDTFTFGATTVMAPAGSKSFTQDVDLRPAQNLIVRIEAGLNEFSGVILWRFTSLDPATMQPTEDPLAGFLPPNKVKPEGQGILTYKIQAKQNLVNGTTFGSGARIVFDTNDPIDTQPWFNRIDTESPVSHVLPLSLDSEGRILVTWSGTDAGAGVKDYTVYVSVDGGEYTPWLSATTDTAAHYAGSLDHHYAFYSVARDWLDHVEAAPSEPDATSDGLGEPQVCPPEQLGAPVLQLQGAHEMTLECGQSTWVDPGAAATDGCGFPLEVHRYNSGSDEYGPGPDTQAESTNIIEYIAWDASGATVVDHRTVHVDDRTAPTLKLKGAASLTHTCGSAWVDPGVEALDACYGDVSQTVDQSGYVNGWAEGVYTVTYSVTDVGGNSAPPVSRTVEVVDCPW